MKYYVWNNIKSEVEIANITLDQALAEVEGAIENFPDYNREDLEIREED